MRTAHQRHEPVPRHPPTLREAKRRGPRPHPHPRHLATARVVLLRPCRDLTLVVLKLPTRRAELADAQHSPPPLIRGHKTDTPARKATLTPDHPDPGRTTTFAGHSPPPVAARYRLSTPPESMVRKGSSVRVRQRALADRLCFRGFRGWPGFGRLAESGLWIFGSLAGTSALPQRARARLRSARQAP
jgi:hypothetical protein